MPRKNVTVADLEWAATWLEAFEDEDGIPALESESEEWDVQTAKRVSAWLQKEINRRTK